MKIYYLDTSSIRMVGKRLKSLSESHYFSTSALTLIELLNGICKDDAEFSRRGSSIRNILQSKTAVNWDMPDRPMALCFDEIVRKGDFIEMRIDPLRAILDCLLSCKSRAEFIEREACLKLEHPLEYFSKFDDNFAGNYIEETSRGNREIRAAFDRAKAGEADSSIPSEVMAGSFHDFCVWWFTNTDRDFDFTVHGFATRLADIMGNKSETMIENLRGSYNGSIDIFMKALSKSAMLMTTNMSTPARNDAVDLGHFLYLKPGMTFISEDIKARDLAGLVNVKSISISELTE